jgi:hypothetical protein
MKFTARLLIAATLLFALGCAKTDWIDRTLVTVDVTGAWAGSARIGIASGQAYELEQQGATVKGSMRYTGGSASQREESQRDPSRAPWQEMCSASIRREACDR